MNRTELGAFIMENYNAVSDFPWIKYPTYEVFRHTGSRKWFAVIMDIPKSRLGIKEDGNINIVNLKCDTIMVGSLRNEKGFFRRII